MSKVYIYYNYLLLSIILQDIKDRTKSIEMSIEADEKEIENTEKCNVLNDKIEELKCELEYIKMKEKEKERNILKTSICDYLYL